MNAELLQQLEDNGRKVAHALYGTGVLGHDDVWVTGLARVGWPDQKLRDTRFWRSQAIRCSSGAMARDCAFIAGVAAEIEERTK
jgi:hypothetical protein